VSRGIIIKTEDEIELLRLSDLMVSETLALMGEMLKPGVKSIDLDKRAEEYIRDNGGIPSFKGYEGFTASLCISVNDAVVHGIPSDYEIKDGDVVSIDCGVYMNGFHGDAAYTFAVGDVAEETMKLLRATNKSLYLGIEMAVVGNRVGDIGYAIQNYTEKQLGYGVVREMVGHGVGRDLHEKPEVPNYGKRGRGVVLKENMTIAIEPMINLGTKSIKVLRDGWTIVTRDGKPSAHYEHSLVVKKDKADLLSDHKIIEESIKNNINIKKL
jgi:methionyl aminopeptidase